MDRILPRNIDSPDSAEIGEYRGTGGYRALARVLHKHPVVVSRWVSVGRRLREEDQEFSAALEAFDKAPRKRRSSAFAQA